MSKLLDVFKQRDDAVKKWTQAILNLIPHVTEGVIQHLNIRKELQGGSVVWEDISYFSEGGEDKGYVMLVAVVSYKPGESYQLPTGQVIEITADNLDYFRRFVRIGVPIKLAVENSVEAVVDFLHKSSQQAEAEDDLIKEALSQEMGTKAPEQNPQQQGPDFNLDDLTEEQKAALQQFNISGTKN